MNNSIDITKEVIVIVVNSLFGRMCSHKTIMDKIVRKAQKSLYYHFASNKHKVNKSKSYI